MGKQDLPKYQSCILKVNIHCEGCEHKVRKLLQKTDGVYSVNIDADSGKVLVAGNMDPAKLIKKLKRSGKHAELWGGQRGNMYNQNYPPINQFKNLQIDPAKMGKHNDPHKVIGMNLNQQKGGGGHQPHFQNKGAKNLMVPVKNQKSVKFNLPEEDDFDASDDGDEDLDEFDDDEEFDDYEDEEEDEEEVGHAHPLMPNKANMMMMGGVGMANGRGPHAGPATNFHKANGGVNGKKGNVIDLAVQMKGKGGNKNGNGGGKKKNEERGGIKKDKGGKRKAGGDKKNGKSSGGFLGRLLGLGKKSKKADTPKFKKNGAPNNDNRAHSKEAKKSGARFEGHNFKKLDDDNDDGFQDFDIPIKPKPGKGVKGNGHGMPAKMGHMAPPPAQMGPMDQMRNIPMSAVQGLPAAAAMNAGFYQGMQMQPPRPLPYNPQQQQYMAMMMNQQHQANMNHMYPAMMYGRPQGPMGYMPPPPMPSHPMADPMTHVFSDENTESCAIM